jgi:hypothetical protein
VVPATKKASSHADDEICADRRARRSYPALVAHGLRLDADQVRDVSYSGATIVHAITATA